jgi:hypothetical protein
MIKEAPAAGTASAAITPREAPGSHMAVLGWVRRHRTWTLLLLVFTVGVVLTVIGQLTPRDDSTALSIHNPAPDGARAAAEILKTRGVDVSQTDSYGATMSALGAGRDSGRADGEVTVLLYDRNGYLDRNQLQRLAGATGRVVVVTPRLTTLTALGNEIRPAGVVPDSVSTLNPGCGLQDPVAAGPVTAGAGYLYQSAVLCYRPSAGFGGLYASADNGGLVVLGSSRILSNEGLDEKGNAALALRTLGSSKRLVWYLPGIADVPVSSSPKTLDELAPPWVAFLGPWLALVVALAMFWQGRRLGPLVFEPLPVVVKAVETVEGRARLYHDSHAVDRAADNLRSGTLVRLARILRLGPGATTVDIAASAARHLGRSTEDMTEVLDARPRTESELVQWAQRLDRLEKEVTAP